MDNAEYWRKRAIEREEQWHKKSQETIEKELALQYEATLHHLNKEIESLYAKFAKDNAISMHKARELIQGSEHRVWRMDIEEYIKAIDKTSDKGLLRELNTLAMRSRISRLDKLYGETLMELDKLGRYTSERTRQFLHDAYEKNRTDTAKDYLTKGKGPVNVKVDPKRIEDVLRHPWSGKVYSQRIWRGMDRLSKAIKEEIVNGVHRGDSIDKMTKRIQERMEVSRRDAVRLVRTEMSYVNNQAALDSIKGAKMKYFRFIATIDKRTSTACKDHNDHVYAIEDAQIGTNVPPLHPHCRSTIAGTLRGPAIDSKEPTKVAQTKVAEVEGANTTKLEPPKPSSSSKLSSTSKANQAKEQPTAKIIIHKESPKLELRESNDILPKNVYHKTIDTTRQKDVVDSIMRLKDTFNEDIIQNIQKILSLGLDDGKEHLAILNLKGKLGHKIEHGDVDKVSFSEELKDYLGKQPKNSLICLHNHPNNTNFSFCDLSIMASQFEAIGELIVVCHNGVVHSCSIGAGERQFIESLSRAYDSAVSKAIKLINEKIRLGKLDRADADEELNYEILKGMAAVMGWKYERYR